MIINYFNILFQLLVFTSGWLVVYKEQQCQCENLLYESDCQIFAGCYWMNGACGTLKSRILQTSDFCSSISSQYCAFTKGCAYINSNCILFAGCTAYVYNSDKICKSISIDCTSDGQRCIQDQCTSCSDSKQCKDAPITYNTHYQCKQWLPKCFTNGKGCTDQPLPCSSFTDCLNSVGQEGQCWPSETNECRKQMCEDAQYTTNYQCNQFLQGCVTNGKKCVRSLLPCSELLDCDGIYGIDGWCVSENQKCRKVECKDAILQFYSNSGCNQFLSGCITNGVACVEKLENCDTYYGDQSQCEQYIGLDGFCTSGETQSKCKSKVCSQAIYKTNIECQNYSYNCVTNGISCELQLSQCTNGCVDQSSCINYKTYQQCVLNQQQYRVGDKIYLRPCLWVQQACINSTCPTTSSLITDKQCQSVVQGCVTNGAGCIDISSPCTSYQGTQKQCWNFTGLNGTQQCTNIAGSGNCVAKTCQNIAYSLLEINQETCESWLAGCNFDLRNGCTNGSCTTYFGTQSECKSINTAKDSQGNKQWCWGDNNGGCRVRQCQDAIVSSQNLFNTDAQCEQFLSGCVTNGGGCLQKDSPCSYYQGNMSQCQKFSQSQKGCTLAGRCKKFQCTDIIIPVNLQKLDQDKFCQQYFDDSRTNCLAGISTCIKLVSLNCSKQVIYCQYQKVALGQTIIERQSSCYKQKCAFKSGNYCQIFECSLFQPVGNTLQDKAQYCQNLVYQGLKTCGLSSDSSYCSSLRQCNDLGLTTAQQCTNYLPNCAFSNFTQKCYLPYIDCKKYQIPSNYDNLMKAQYCTSLQNQLYTNCSYDLMNPDYCAQKISCGNLAVINGVLLQRIQFCQAQNCGYDINQSKCVNLGYCSKYTITGSILADNILYCSSILNFQGYQCIFKLGNTSCQDPNLTITDPCSQYTALINNENVCKSIPLLNCSYLNGSYCKKFECTDLKNESTCKTYAQCVFNGSQCELPSVPTCSNLGYACNQSLCTRRPDLSICKTTNIKCSQFNLSYDQLKLTSTQKSVICSQVTDSKGNKCLWSSSTPYNCSGQKCDNLLTAKSDIGCIQWSSGCILDRDYTSSCSLISCSDAPSNYITNTQCSSFRFSCVSNGQGCVESTIPCSQYKGTQSQCHYFIGNGKQCSNNLQATADSQCVDKSCDINISALNDQDCEKWMPSLNNIRNCIWNGTVGCIKATTTCSQLLGDVNQCSKYLAQDGPCSGTDSIGPCFQQICNKAPETHNTDYLCKQWHPKCITTGQGCINFSDASCPLLKNDSSCIFYKYNLNCDVAKKCPDYNFTSCSQIKYSELCRYFQLPNELQCVWNYQSQECINLTCEQLSDQITTDYECNYQLKGCITTGQGCYKYGPCSSYDQAVCNNLKSTDVQQQCLWDQSCRPLKCSDNKIATTDKQCDQFLKGCRNFGVGCVDQFQCSQFLSQDKCTKDSQDRNCFWYKSCILYNSCEDIKGTSNQECQAFSEYCITDGQKCIPYTKCSEYRNQISCLKGTDGICGFLPNLTCDLFRSCNQAQGRSLQECQRWNIQCISDGTKCVEKHSLCQYFTTQVSCTDSDMMCIWDQINCRLPLCQDAPKYYNTYNQCQGFSKLQQCTTNGNGCQSLNICSSYLIQEACYAGGTDGKCKWVDSSCQKYECYDYPYQTDSECEQAFPDSHCISDRQNCFKRQFCYQYSAESMCRKGGFDGSCVFSPKSLPQQGLCQLFAICEQANDDRQTCLSRPDVCLFKEYVDPEGNIVQTCQTHTCQTYSALNGCKSFLSLDFQSIQICLERENNQCLPGEPKDVEAENCLKDSMFTHTWNSSSRLCQPCPGFGQLLIEFNVYLDVLSFYGVVMILNI